jgi:glutathione S-transferase
MEEGYRSLAVMEHHLKHRRYFAEDRYTVADIALYAYTHLAHACDYDLTSFPEIRGWLERVAAQPDHVTLDWQPANAVPAE